MLNCGNKEKNSIVNLHKSQSYQDLLKYMQCNKKTKANLIYVDLKDI